MSESKKWVPFVLFVTNDHEIERRISPAFQDYGDYFSTQNTGVAMKIIDQRRVDVLLIDESLYQDKTIASKYRKYIFELYKKAIEKNAKVVTLVLFSKRNSNFINEFPRKSEVLIKLDRNNIDENKIRYLLLTFSRQKYRSVVIKDFKLDTKMPVPLFVQDDENKDDDNNGVELFLEEGEVFSKEKSELLHRQGYNRIFVKSDDLQELFSTHQMYFSEETHLARKRYKFFLSYFLDHSSDEKTFIGNQLSELGRDIIGRLQKLIAKFDTPYEALCELPYTKWSEITHGLNTAIYILIWGKELGIKNIEEIAFAGLIHDHGKFEINFKPGTHGKFFSNLTDNIDYKKHPTFCMEMLQRKCLRLQRRTLDAILCHHENYDGTGFPRGLSGDDLTMEASLISLADLFDHLKTIHTYNHHVTPEHAWYETIEVHKKSLLGLKFNPRMMEMITDFFEKQSDKKKTA